MTSPAPLPPHPALHRYYGDASRREKWVRLLFDDTASSYDAIIAGLSFGSGTWYRRYALNRAGFRSGMRLLDVATGTGVVARAAAGGNGHSAIVGVDPSLGMLLAGRDSRPGSAVQAIAERLPFRDASFEFLTVGFALRHFADLRATFSEYQRVLAPGGRVLILEITAPSGRIARSLLALYMGRLVPFAARLFTRSERAGTLMRYYWETTRECVPPQAILGALTEAGFGDVKRETDLGIFSAYSATAKNAG